MLLGPRPYFCGRGVATPLGCSSPRIPALRSGTMGSAMSTHRYNRFKTFREEQANTFNSRCARYFAQDFTPDDPGESAYSTQCPCATADPSAPSQAAGCEYLTFDQLPPEQQKVYRSRADQIVDAVSLSFAILFVLWVFRLWMRTRREDRARVLELRAAAAEEEAKWLAGLSGRKFVRVQQPDTSVELAEIVVSTGDGDGDEIETDGGETARCLSTSHASESP